MNKLIFNGIVQQGTGLNHSYLTIGTQRWAKNNYKETVTAMGTTIQGGVYTDAAWAALTTPAWCYNNNDAGLNDVYGKLYNWYAVKLINDDINAYNILNPTSKLNYRVPNDDDFNSLSIGQGGVAVSGGALKEASDEHWKPTNVGATNSSLMGLLPCGNRNEMGFFTLVGASVYIWSITELTTSNATVFYNLIDQTSFNSISKPKKRGCSLRMIETITGSYLLNSFWAKYNTKTMSPSNQLNVVMYGDSIFGRMNGTEISNNLGEATGSYPPNMWQQLVASKVLNHLQFNNSDVKYKNLSAWTKTGTWALRSPVLLDGQRVFRNATLNDYAEIVITGASFFKMLHYRERLLTANQLTITFNGSTPSALGLIGPDTFSTLSGITETEFYKWANNIWAGLNPATTYTVRITNTGGAASTIWGCEYWSNARINVIVSAHGGYTSAEHKAQQQAWSGSMYAPDLLIHELPCLNDSYDSHYKGYKSPNSAGISAVATDFINALTEGIYVNYSSLSLTAGQYAEYNGTAWVVGSTIAAAKLAAYANNISYLETMSANGVPTIYILPHKTTSDALNPMLVQMKAIVKAKVNSFNGLLLDLDALYIAKGWVIAGATSDGTHLNDIGVDHYFEILRTVI